MRGRDRHAHFRRSEKHRRRGGFRSEPMDGLKFDHLVAKRLDDAPAARGRSRRHCQGTKHLYPKIDMLILGVGSLRCVKKTQPGWKMIEYAGLGGAREGQGYDT